MAVESHAAEAAGAVHAAVPFYGDPTFWVAAGFILFCGLLVYLKVPRQAAAALDDRAARIRSQIDEAAALRAEAETMLAAARQQQADAARDAESIIATARDEASSLVAAARAQAAQMVERRTQRAEAEIAAAERAAIGELRSRTAALATQVATRMIREGGVAFDSARLTDQAIGDLDRRLH